MTVKVRLKRNREITGEATARYKKYVKVHWHFGRLGFNPQWFRIVDLVFVVPAGRRVI